MGEAGAQEHEEEGQPEVPGGELPEDEDGKEYPDEGSHGVVGAGSGGPQIPLGPDVEVDTESIGHQTQEKGSQNEGDAW